MDEWPAWAIEQVRVQPPHEDWQRRGARLCRELDAVLADWLVEPTQHVGSTAVPGLASKPIVDVQAAVVDLGCSDAVARVLLPAGWHFVPPELDARPWRRFLVQVIDEHRAAHLHLLPAGSPRWTEQLEFRDALRADPELTHRYAELKRALAAKHATDREAYSAGKAKFVRSVLGMPEIPDQG
ncbi:GrpB family protein [Citricoccus sp.]|uniref:GrpB family protein n=1 Tax=Citricoccus sp. TaxID=1978372 RepID=UPI00261E78F8|nr:GrpB family protein [Citricoccus sp.]HRO31307.1 GrpB family protein [Citricoccus sp.]